MYKIATKEIRVDEVLDGKSVSDYTARVEPNESGGKKMAVKFVELLDKILQK